MKHDQINPAQDGQAVDRSRQMLQCEHFDTKGGKRPFAAGVLKVRKVAFSF
jgi:hypothetical protein